MPSTLSSEIAFLESQLSVGIVFGNQNIFSSSSSVPNNQTYLQPNLKESMDFTQEIPWVFPWVFQGGFPLEGVETLHHWTMIWAERPHHCRTLASSAWWPQRHDRDFVAIAGKFHGDFQGFSMDFPWHFQNAMVWLQHVKTHRWTGHCWLASFLPRNSTTHPPKWALKAASSC